jgi:hypothetical protein
MQTVKLSGPAFEAGDCSDRRRKLTTKHEQHEIAPEHHETVTLPEDFEFNSSH